jgi:hypothetical protein
MMGSIGLSPRQLNNDNQSAAFKTLFAFFTKQKNGSVEPFCVKINLELISSLLRVLQAWPKHGLG